MVDLDSETLFNAAAAAVSTVAAVFFIVNVEYAYSPVSKFLLVLLFLAGIFAITQRTGDRQVTALGYGVVVTTGVALFFEVVNTFDVGDLATVLGLLAIAAVLFSLRTRLDDRHRFTSARRATAALGVVAVLAVLVLAADVASGGLAYELQPESEVVYGDDGREGAPVATLAVTNPTPLPERVRAPRYGACAAGNWSAYRPPADAGEQPREVHIHVDVRDGYNDHVAGFGTRTYPVVLHLNGANLEGARFPVQVTSACPDDRTGAAYVALFEENRR